MYWRVLFITRSQGDGKDQKITYDTKGNIKRQKHHSDITQPRINCLYILSLL